MRTVRVQGVDSGKQEAVGYGGLGVLLLLWVLTEYGRRKLGA